MFISTYLSTICSAAESGRASIEGRISPKISAVGELKAALRDVFGADLAGEVVQPVEQEGMDLPKALDGSNQLAVKDGAIPQFVRALLAPLVQRRSHAFNPVRKTDAVLTRQDEQHAVDALLRETVC